MGAQDLKLQLAEIVRRNREEQDAKRDNSSLDSKVRRSSTSVAYELRSPIVETGPTETPSGEEAFLKRYIFTEAMRDEDEAKWLGRIIDQIRIGEQLDHPNHIQLLHYEEPKKNVHCLLYTLAEGETLDKILQRRNLKTDEILNIAEQVSGALSYSHDEFSPPIIHGDLSPGNVKYDETTGLVKLLDHGASIREIMDGSSETTRALTPGYGAPEIGRGEIFPASDVLSLGVLLAYMITKHAPRTFFNYSNELQYDHLMSLVERGTTNEGLIDLVKDMVPPNPEDRLKASEVYDRIQELKRARATDKVTVPLAEGVNKLIGEVREAGFDVVTGDLISGSDEKVGKIEDETKKEIDKMNSSHDDNLETQVCLLGGAGVMQLQEEISKSGVEHISVEGSETSDWIVPETEITKYLKSVLGDGTNEIEKIRKIRKYRSSKSLSKRDDRLVSFCLDNLERGRYNLSQIAYILSIKEMSDPENFLGYYRHELRDIYRSVMHGNFKVGQKNELSIKWSDLPNLYNDNPHLRRLIKLSAEGDLEAGDINNIFSYLRTWSLEGESEVFDKEQYLEILNKLRSGEFKSLENLTEDERENALIFSLIPEGLTFETLDKTLDNNSNNKETGEDHFHLSDIKYGRRSVADSLLYRIGSGVGIGLFMLGAKVIAAKLAGGSVSLTSSLMGFVGGYLGPYIYSITNKRRTRDEISATITRHYSSQKVLEKVCDVLEVIPADERNSLGGKIYEIGKENDCNITPYEILDVIKGQYSTDLEAVVGFSEKTVESGENDELRVAAEAEVAELGLQVVDDTGAYEAAQAEVREILDQSGISLSTPYKPIPPRPKKRG